MRGSLSASLLTITESGLATGLVEGAVTIVATKNEIHSNLVNITVTSAVLESIQVTPASISLAKGNSVQLTAQGLYSDGSSANISDSVAWQPSDNAVITVSASGLLTADNVGHGTVVATKDSVSSNIVTVAVTEATLESIKVTPNILELAKGNSFQLMAEGRYSDETKVDITHSVTWKSSESTLVSIDKLGVVIGKNEGSVEIHASKDSINSHKVEVSVTSAVLNEIQLTPKINAVSKGNSAQLNAQGLYSDGSIVDLSSAVTWKSSDPSLVTVTESGVATGVTEGDVSIVASKEGIDSNEAAVSVTAALLHTIQVSPATVNLGKGKSSQLTAIGLYTDSSSANISNQVTWKSYNSAVVTVTPTGLVTGISVGKGTVEASKDNIYGNDVIVDVTTTCVNPTIARNQLIELIKAENINAIETFDTSCITDMSQLFSNSTLSDLDLTGWDTSNVIDMGLMFLNASNFNGNLSSWDVSSVRTISGMFHSARAFNGDISLWNTSNVTVMDEVFFSASSFNGNLSGWDVSKASSMRMMFYGARKFNSDISTWNTSRVWRMSNMFENASAFDQNISGWNTSNVELMSYMFAGASSFNQDLSGWNVGKVKSSNNFVNYLSNREFTSDKHPRFK
ncbi:BspA family leucine-rich repeat surface protein [Vibrio scophthalmi]|uniref:BspA family leucine-rich repeat surface protein n=1 Tax=Vibrio scophthalmi TaxID=45658 RepID=UPI003AB030B4